MAICSVVEGPLGPGKRFIVLRGSSHAVAAALHAGRHGTAEVVQPDRRGRGGGGGRTRRRRALMARLSGRCPERGTEDRPQHRMTRGMARRRHRSAHHRTGCRPGQDFATARPRWRLRCRWRCPCRDLPHRCHAGVAAGLAHRPSIALVTIAVLHRFGLSALRVEVHRAERNRRRRRRARSGRCGCMAGQDHAAGQQACHQRQHRPAPLRLSGSPSARASASGQPEPFQKRRHHVFANATAWAWR